VLARLGVDKGASATNPGDNMEGKELRFCVANSRYGRSPTTAASNGSVNSSTIVHAARRADSDGLTSWAR